MTASVRHVANRFGTGLPSDACKRMLHWRACTWELAAEQCRLDPRIAAVFPAEPVLLVVPSEKLLLGVTDSPRLATGPLKAAVEALDPARPGRGRGGGGGDTHGLGRMQLVSRYPINNQTQT